MSIFPNQDCYHPSTDIDTRAKALESTLVSWDDNSPDMERGMHLSINIYNARLSRNVSAS
jgi:hypothetical protein